MKQTRPANATSIQSSPVSLLYAEQVRLLYSSLPAALFANMLLASLLVGIQWPTVNPTLALGWLILTGIVLILRAYTYFLYRRSLDNPHNTAPNWLQRFRMGAIATGFAWGFAGELLFPAGNISHQVFLAFVLAGVTAGAITSLAADRVAALGFVVPALLPLVVKFVIEGGAMPLAMGLMVTLFLLFVTASAGRTRHHLHENIRLNREMLAQEAALREQVQHTQTILDNMVDGIITIDQSGIIDSCNPAAERIFGYPAIEALGQSVKILMPNPHRDAHNSYLRNYQTTGTAQIIGIGREVEGQRKDGTLFPLELAISEITRQGKTMYVGMVRDISERKRIEQMKNEFVSTVSHELRTPLTSICGALGLISGNVSGNLPAQVQQLISIASKNSQRLTQLINDLLDIEKLVVGKLHFEMQSQALMPLIEQALEANRAYGAERRVKLTISGATPDAAVRVDSQRLMQILSNLLSNAIKYSPEDGTVVVRVTTQDTSIRVTVSDCGPGIPAEFRTRIFHKFAQADSSDTRQKGGTGLGLAITKELIEHMSGQIGFESVEGDGASFFIELPLCESISLTAAIAANGTNRR